MLLAAFEPGKEMAIANFFLAIFCLFTIALPLLLITRGEKTQANRKFIAATVNPWSQIVEEIELPPAVITEINSTNEVQPKLEVISENRAQPISTINGVNSIDSTISEEQDEYSSNVLITENEVLAA